MSTPSTARVHLILALLVGLASGLLLQPYKFLSLQLGPVQQLWRVNRLTGNASVADPYTRAWQPIRVAALPPTAPDVHPATNVDLSDYRQFTPQFPALPRQK